MLTLTRIRLSLLTAIILVGGLVAAQSQIARAQALTDRMPIDPAITIGKFPNGLRYYIRANKKPEKRAELLGQLNPDNRDFTFRNLDIEVCYSRAVV